MTAKIRREMHVITKRFGSKWEAERFFEMLTEQTRLPENLRHRVRKLRPPYRNDQTREWTIDYSCRADAVLPPRHFQMIEGRKLDDVDREAIATGLAHKRHPARKNSEGTFIGSKDKS